MSQRSKIVKALVTKLKNINGVSPYVSNLYNKNVLDKLRFWDEVNDFPFICVVAGNETREYHPGNFKWGFLNIALKLYVRGEDSQDLLEKLISDVERIIDLNENLVIDGGTTTEILINSIVTDEGLLAPYGVGEINILVRYQVS